MKRGTSKKQAQAAGDTGKRSKLTVNEPQFCQNIDILDIDNHPTSGRGGAGAGPFDNDDQMQLTLNPKILRDSFVTLPPEVQLATMKTPQNDGFQDEIMASRVPSRNAAAAAKKQMTSTQSSISLIKPAEEARFNLGSKNLSRHSSNSKLKKGKANQQRVVKQSQEQSGML